jgi:hypothetical protein
MKRALATLIGLTLYVVLAAWVPSDSARPAHPAAATNAGSGAAVTLFASAGGKCATCQELLQSCRSFCGTTHVNFSCDPKSPCAGTCSCLP